MRLTKEEWETLGWECSRPDLSYITFKDISSDSQIFKKNWVFFAYDGLTHRGKDFIPMITKKNPAAVFTSEAYKKDLLKRYLSFPVFFSKEFLDSSITTISYLYSHPSKKLTLVGITGTNGKSSIALFLHNLFRNLEKESLCIGTLGALLKHKNFSLKNTTPDFITLNQLFKKAVRSQVEYAFLEVSSHALDQNRVKGLNFSIAVFSNLTQDHLDYHKNMTNYFESKKKLFKSILEQQKKEASAIGFIIYMDDPYGLKLYRWLKPRAEGLMVLGLGSLAECDLRIIQIKTYWDGTEASFSFQKKNYFLRSKLIGDLNILNILMAILTGFLLGLPFKKMLSVAEGLKAIRGRGDIVYRKRGQMIVIDYAHTPDALEKVLGSLRRLQPDRIILVFGCGGNRDNVKRSKMGEAAARFADVIILTNDNPRGEEPTRIVKDIQRGIKNKIVDIVLDRKKAIYQGIRMLKKGDLLLIAGKGHETYQIIGKQKKYFSDYKAVNEGLKNL